MCVLTQTKLLEHYHIYLTPRPPLQPIPSPNKKNPFLLGGEREGGVRDEDRDVDSAEMSALVGQWTAPFMMAEVGCVIIIEDTSVSVQFYLKFISFWGLPKTI